MGAVGSGKTTLAAKLSGKKLDISHFGASATRQSTIYRTFAFEFSDTPGFQSVENKLNHAVNIICALHHRPISRLFILIKYECRLDRMYNNVIDIVKSFNKLRSSMALIVTAWDESDGSEDLNMRIAEYFTEKLKIGSILFSGHNYSRIDLLFEMRRQLQNTPITVKIQPETIWTLF
jgi:GTPase Era involved in 16S rRNA processing